MTTMSIGPLGHPPWMAAWLDHARRLLTDEGHIRACDKILGDDAVARADASDLRWPGYVGVSYEPGGLLLVATVHREFASGSPPLPEALRDRLVAATRDWRDRRIDDEAWLAELRVAYVAGLGTHWNVGKLLRNLGRRIGVTVERVASVNAARCQIVENPPPIGHVQAKKGVLVACAADFPIADVLQILQPGLLIMAKGTYDAAASLLPDGVPLVVADQRQLCLRAPLTVDGNELGVTTKIEVWAPKVAHLLADVCNGSRRARLGVTR
jgi:hypothetical protein